MVMKNSATFRASCYEPVLVFFLNSYLSVNRVILMYHLDKLFFLNFNSYPDNSVMFSN
jgi:hypothetical protein